MNDGARIRINRETGEIEISGSEQFVKEHMNLVHSVLNMSAAEAPAPVAVQETVVETAAPAAPVAEEAAQEPAVAPVKRGRGRPKKAAAPVAAVEADAPAPVKEAKPKAAKAPKIPSSFSAYMKSFKRKMKKGDWILASGYYFQESTNSDTFSTFNTSKLLKSQGVDLANPSQYMKNNVSSGRIEIVGNRAYKVTEEGKKHLNQLMTKK